MPSALGHIALARLRSLDKVESGLEFIVPIAIFIGIVIAWIKGSKRWMHILDVPYLSWGTLRLIAKVALASYIIAARPQARVGSSLKDTIVLWIANVLLFGAWYWIIDAGGPHIRRDGPAQRFDFVFPQRAAIHSGWEDWKPSFWDYVYLGYCGSTQFGLADTLVLSLRAKFLLMLQATLSVTIIVFIASIAITLTH